MNEIGNAFENVGNKVVGWGKTFIEMLPNIAVALLVFVLFWFLAKFVSRLVKKTSTRITTHHAVVNLLGTLTRVTVLVAGLFVALSLVQLDGTVTSLLAGVGIIGIALGFAFQDIAANFVSGVLLAINRPFEVGDLIESADFKGRVEQITLRWTQGRSLDGQVVFLPNKEVFENPITNYNRAPDRRVAVEIGVAYGDDLEKAEQIALSAVEKLGIHKPERPLELFYTAFGDSSINFVLRFWVESSQHAWLAARSAAIKAVKVAFDDAGITIPFPIRTLDFGVVGGEPLREALPTWLGRGNGNGNGHDRAPEPRDVGAM